MAMDQSALLEVLEALKAADVDERIRAATQTLYQALIDAELTAVIGAGPWERSAERTGQRNGSRPRTLSTTAGDLELPVRSVDDPAHPATGGGGHTRTHDGMISTLTAAR